MEKQEYMEQLNQLEVKNLEHVNQFGGEYKFPLENTSNEVMQTNGEGKLVYSYSCGVENCQCSCHEE